MKAMLLSAGLGVRLRPITNTVPKCLVPINGRPLMDYWLHALFACGMERVLVNLHYFPEKVREFIEQSPFSDRVDLVEESELLGTAGTLKVNSDYFNDGSFLVAHADNFCVTNLRKFLTAHVARNNLASMTMMTFATSEPTQCGIVELNEEGLVVAFHEKKQNPPGNLANAAVYIMESEVLDVIGKCDQIVSDISLDVIPKLLPYISTWQNSECHIDVGTIARYEQACVAEREYRNRIMELGWF